MMVRGAVREVAVQNTGARRPVTSADVARRAGVSTATVSYVLNGAPGQSISAQTKAAVLGAAKDLGYRPNLVARHLRTGGSGLVLYVVPRMPLGEVLIEVASRLTAALSQRGLVLSLQVETTDAQDVIDAIHNLRPMAVTSVFPLGGRVRDAVEAAGLPQVYLGSANLQTLESLNDSLGRVWVEHLVSRGHRQLAFAYSGDEKLRAQGDYWLSGLRAAASQAGLPDVAAATVPTTGGSAAAVVEDWKQSGVTAVCAQTDLTALMVLRGIHKLGLRCPGDVAVIGADAGELGHVSDPLLTSVSFNIEAIARQAVTALMTQLGLDVDFDVDDSPAPGATEFVALIQREST